MNFCAICGKPVEDGDLRICEACEDAYANEAGQAKFRKKAHVVDGGTWWRVRRDKKSA